MNSFIKLSAGVLAISILQPSFASNWRDEGSWTHSGHAPSVLREDELIYSWHVSPHIVPKTATVTSVEWVIPEYRNGARRQDYKICLAINHSIDGNTCHYISDRYGSTNAFNGMAAGAEFVIMGALRGGGTYPVIATHQNTVTVKYK